MRSKYAIWNKTYLRDMKTNITVKIQIMAYTNFERTVKRIILTRIFYSWNALKRIKPMNWSFSACIKNQNFKKWENEDADDLDLFLKGLNFMRNKITNPMLVIMGSCFKSLTKRYICQLTKCEHEDVSKSIDSDDSNFSSVKPQQLFFFFFLNRNISFPDCS